MNSTQLQKIFTKTLKTSTCWLYTGKLNHDGYGRLRYDGRLQMVHRIMYKFYYGLFEENLRILHKCDTRNCIHPDHLLLGTQADNITDMYNKGRGNKQGNAKITLAVAEEIRNKYREGESQKELIKFYSLNSSQISRIINNLRWKKELHNT